ncbi:LCP family protein [Streptomyces bathyalis]|uniref:LCP family protein n=1 Tax=Streptomyces bathyalis TaxID=2710756 RepID=A0A7T1WPW6_9ACTN|nr:LCP family protein [Streptomyces bathyalis]QPP05588.1 LCP family protein [Streptomyces bathyalis]
MLALACAVCAALTCGAALDASTVATNAPAPPGGSERVSNAFDKLPESGRPAKGPGTNVLLAGLDRREGLSKKTKNRLHVNGEQCDCTDVMMLLHVSADRDRVSVVSIPRDSYVRFAKHRDHGKGFGKITDSTTRHLGKINSAYAHGGPALTIRTVEQSTGVRIDHYAETDFPGFEKTVNRLKGVKVCSAKPMEDKNSGLKLAQGTHVLNGNKAVRFVRARHVDPPGDLGRARRQQHVVGELLRTLTSDGTAAQPLEVLRAAAALRGSVRWDKGFTTARLSRLARDLQGLTAKRTEFATVPILDFDHRSPVWGSTLRWDGPRARALFADLRADRPITGSTVTGPAPGATPVPYRPEEVTVRVEGSGDTAAHIEQELRDNGFKVMNPRRASAAGPRGGRTEITYDVHWQRKASTVSAAMPGAVMRAQKVTGTKHSDVFTVRPGTEGTDVADVVYDRSSVEGAPVRGDELDCDGRTQHNRS